MTEMQSPIVESWRCAIQCEPERGASSVYIAGESDMLSSEIYRVRLEYDTAQRFSRASRPTFRNDGWECGNGAAKNHSLLQAIVDAAWDAGYRPTGLRDANETLRARLMRFWSRATRGRKASLLGSTVKR